MELIFIRHGQPAWTMDGMARQDPELTQVGLRQAALLAERLAAETPPITEILVSPAVRTRQTAAPLSEMTGIAPEVVDDIVEIVLPDWTGELQEKVQRIFLEARDRPPDAWWDGLPGGETFRAFHQRIAGAMRRILGERSVRPDDTGRPHLWHAEPDQRRVAIVAHGGTNAVALGVLLGVEPTPWEWERFLLGHASIARVRVISLAGAHVFSLRAFNDREHLPRDLRTR